MKMLFNIKKKSLVHIFMDKLKVKNNSGFTQKYIEENPHKRNLYGIATVLKDYGIENKALQIHYKDTEIYKLPVPCIVQYNQDFIIVEKINSDTVDYTNGEFFYSNSIQDFIKNWTGIVLIAYPDKNSIEPDYKKNKQTEWIKKFKIIGLIFFSLFLLGRAISMNTASLSWVHISGVLVNIIGLYISYMLIITQYYGGNYYADRICSMFHKGNCNDILFSNASKLWGVVSWSEVGLSYFLGNIVLLIFVPLSIQFVAMINCLTLPYTIWSIWFQKFKAKVWCPLCVMVQITLWALFISNLLFGLISLPVFDFNTLALVGNVYALIYVAVSLVLGNSGEETKKTQLVYEFNSLKARKEIVEAVLLAQPKYEIDRDFSKITWGNPNAGIMLTIITNPHCPPCGKMHHRMNSVLKRNKNLCVQYVFRSYIGDSEESNYYLTAFYLQNDLQKTEKLYEKWFDPNNYYKKDLFESHPVDWEDRASRHEYEKQAEWIKNNDSIDRTPTVLVNGYLLPKIIKIEDLAYIDELYLTT